MAGGSAGEGGTPNAAGSAGTAGSGGGDDGGTAGGAGGGGAGRGGSSAGTAGAAGNADGGDGGVTEGGDAGRCAARELRIVAHQDDELLFMNPDLLESLHAGHCVRTVYLTAGDAGKGVAYASTRDAGMRAVYAEMAGRAAKISEKEKLVENDKQAAQPTLRRQ